MTPSRPPISRPPVSRSGAFTLVEMLVVIGIILLLSAISFPIFKSIQERGAQTTCASNLQQIYLAVRLYKDDEREYPASLAVLLPDSETLPVTGPTAGPTATPGPNPNPNPNPGPPPSPGATPTPGPSTGNNGGGTGYFRKTREELVCPDDDFQTATDPGTGAGQLRSSYGDVTTDITQGGTATSETITDNNLYDKDGKHNPLYYGAGDTRDWGRTSWNYWGYDDWGQSFRSEAEATAYFRKLPPAQAASLLRTPDKQPTGYESPTPLNLGYKALNAYGPFTPGTPYFNPRGFVVDDGSSNPYEEPRAANMIKYSLSNPQAPLTTIITHCVYHRLLTAKNVINPGANQIYDPAAATTDNFDGTGARDIILRLDGSARSYDISKWSSPDFPNKDHGPNWQISDF